MRGAIGKRRPIGGRGACCRRRCFCTRACMRARRAALRPPACCRLLQGRQVDVLVAPAPRAAGQSVRTRARKQAQASVSLQAWLGGRWCSARGHGTAPAMAADMRCSVRGAHTGPRGVHHRWTAYLARRPTNQAVHGLCRASRCTAGPPRQAAVGPEWERSFLGTPAQTLTNEPDQTRPPTPGVGNGWAPSPLPPLTRTPPR
jgi:hypothetical protein